jgi:hypothetical protein
MRWLIVLIGLVGCAAPPVPDCTQDARVVDAIGTEEYDLRLRACRIHMDALANSERRRRVYMGAAILFGAASDALWVNNVQRDPLGTVAPLRRSGLP